MIAPDCSRPISEQEYWEDVLLMDGYQPENQQVAEKLREAGKRLAERRKHDRSADNQDRDS